MLGEMLTPGQLLQLLNAPPPMKCQLCILKREQKADYLLTQVCEGGRGREIHARARGQTGRQI